MALGQPPPDRRSEVHIRTACSPFLHGRSRTDIRLAVKTHGQVPQGFRRQPVRYKPNEKRTGIEFFSVRFSDLPAICHQLVVPSSSSIKLVRRDMYVVVTRVTSESSVPFSVILITSSLSSSLTSS